MVRPRKAHAFAHRGGRGISDDLILDHSAPTLSPMTRLGRRVTIIGECWAVDGELDRYHAIHVGGGAPMGAHRYVYSELHDVALISEQHVHHTCRHPGCIRPEHLQLVWAGDHAEHHATGEPVAIPAVGTAGAPAWWQEREHG